MWASTWCSDGSCSPIKAFQLMNCSKMIVVVNKCFISNWLYSNWKNLQLICVPLFSNTSVGIPYPIVQLSIKETHCAMRLSHKSSQLLSSFNKDPPLLRITGGSFLFSKAVLGCPPRQNPMRHLLKALVRGVNSFWLVGLMKFLAVLHMR